MSESTDHPAPADDTGIPAPHDTPRRRGRTLRRVAWLGGSVLVVFFALWGWMSLRSGPEAYTLLKIYRKPPSFLFPHPPERDDGLDFEAYGKAQTRLVKTRPVLNAALRTPGAASTMLRAKKDPIGWLHKNLDVDFDKDGGFLRIALRTNPPEDGVILVKAVRDAYLQEVVYKEGESKTRRLARLKEFYLKSEDELRQKRKVLKDMLLVERQKPREEFVFYLRKELIENYSNVRKTEVKLALAGRAKKAEDIAHFQAELNYLKDLGKKLEADFERLTKDLRDLGDKVVDLDFSQKEIDQLDKLTQVVAQQKQQLEIELDAPSRVHELEDAVLDNPRNWQDVMHDMFSWLWQ